MESSRLFILLVAVALRADGDSDRGRNCGLSGISSRKSRSAIESAEDWALREGVEWKPWQDCLYGLAIDSCDRRDVVYCPHAERFEGAW